MNQKDNLADKALRDAIGSLRLKDLFEIDSVEVAPPGIRNGCEGYRQTADPPAQSVGELDRVANVCIAEAPAVTTFEELIFGILRMQLGNLEEMVGQLQLMSLDGRMPPWEWLRDEISALDTIADVMRQALDELDQKGSV